jgi:hypothetical protein
MIKRIKKILGPVYDGLIQLYFLIVCNVNLLRFAFSGSCIPDHYDIPIVINNRNRFTFLKMQIDDLKKRGYNNITVLDNNSTYPPLLDYYKTNPCKIIYLKRNLGYDALEKIPLYNELRKNYFVYTDPDILPIEDCPDNFMELFLETLRKKPQVQKVGFSLKIDDLPDSYNKKTQVIEWEHKYYSKKIGEYFYEAPIDTTFALHRPYATISTKGRLKMYRAAFPYIAYHLPWYNDSENLSDEENYYLDHVEIGTHWSKGLQEKHNIVLISFFKNLFK